jgi:hypothetical protein
VRVTALAQDLDADGASTTSSSLTCSRRPLAGRPSLPADLVGGVLVLKELHALPDRQTAGADPHPA